MIKLSRSWVAPGLLIPLAFAALAVLAMPGEEWPGLAALPLPAPAPAPVAVSDSVPDALPPEARERAAQAPRLDPTRLRVGLRSLDGPHVKLASLDRHLATLSSKKAIATLEQLVLRPLRARTVASSRTVLLGAIERLGRYDSPRATGRLLALVATVEEERELRLAALDALAGRKTHDQPTVAVLLSLADRDQDPLVREQARELLRG
jgi:hypothetical protein